MHGVLRLIQNELSKIFCQLSWKILTLLLLLLSVGLPLLNYVTTGNYENGGFYANAEQNAKDYEEGSIAREYYETAAEGYRFFADQGLTEGTWQYENYISEYAGALENIKGCRLYLEGKKIDEVLAYFNIDGVWLVHQVNDGEESWRAEYSGGLDNGTQFDGNAGNIIFDEDMGTVTDQEKSVPFTPEIAEKIIKEFEKREETVKEKVKQTFEEYAGEQIDPLNQLYQQAKKDYEKAKTDFNSNRHDIREYTAAKLAKEGWDILFDGLERIDLKNVSPEFQNSFSNNLFSVANIIRQSSQYAQISEKDFDSEGYGVYFQGSFYEDYDDYLAAAEQRQEQYYRTVKKYAYGLEYDLPVNDNSGSTRRKVEDCLQINISIIMFMGIFMAAVIVASEHTSGAIRLLMIRPRARWKILFSKLCCLLIFIAGWIISASALTTVTNIMLYGFDDLATPYIMVSHEAFEVAPFLYYLWKLTVCSLPGLSMVFLAFLMSVFVKRSVVAMAIPMMINIFGAPASTLFTGRACKVFPPLKLTPIPYFNLSGFWGDPYEQLNTYNSPLDHGLTLGMGVLMFAIYSLLLIVLSFIVFKKQQIKN